MPIDAEAFKQLMLTGIGLGQRDLVNDTDWAPAP